MAGVPAASLPPSVDRVTVDRAWWRWRELEQLAVLWGAFGLLPHYRYSPSVYR